jgi:hypothetical protein
MRHISFVWCGDFDARAVFGHHPFTGIVSDGSRLPSGSKYIADYESKGRSLLPRPKQNHIPIDLLLALLLSLLLKFNTVPEICRRSRAQDDFGPYW